jgi:hypothetical protein
MSPMPLVSIPGLEFGREPVVYVALKTPKFSADRGATGSRFAARANGYVEHRLEVTLHDGVAGTPLHPDVANSCLGEKVFTLGRHFPRLESFGPAIGDAASGAAMLVAWRARDCQNR